MSLNSTPNGKWKPEMQEALELIQRRQANYSQWRRGLEEAKQGDSRSLDSKRSGPLGWLRGLLLWLKRRK